jgi:hypothetical protein
MKSWSRLNCEVRGVWSIFEREREKEMGERERERRERIKY